MYHADLSDTPPHVIAAVLKLYLRQVSKMHLYPPVHFISPKLGPDPPLPYESLVPSPASFSVIEVKHNVYGKRERQKCHLTMIFPPFSRLPFSTRRGLVFPFVNNASIYSVEVFFYFSATIFSLCSAQTCFIYFLHVNKPVNCQRLHKREEKSTGKRADVWLSPSQRMSTFL